MSTLPTEVYTAFSFIGFVLSAIPLYWHLKARNVGTCLFMIWTGLGCLLQCINSIVWNKNMVNRAPVYCDISTHVQIALNVAIPASSLCINRQLYRVAVMKGGTTDVEKRRNLIYDLLIGVGIPFLQMITEYVVSENRYDIYEDFGPCFSMWISPLSFVLFQAWPVVIGTVSFFYCAMSIYAFYKRRQNHMQLITNANRGQYLRLMAISSVEILGTIPLGTYFIVLNAEVSSPWPGWAVAHSQYSEVTQVAGFIWKNDPHLYPQLELFRWSLVACAFLFFALFGFAREAREHYRLVYYSLARHIGKLAPAPHGALLATPASAPYMSVVANPIVVQMSRPKDSLSISSTDQPSTLSISTESTLGQDSMTLQESDSPKDSPAESFYTANSFHETGMEQHCQLAPSPGRLQTARPVSVPSVPPLVFLPTARPASVASAPPPGIPPTLPYQYACILPHFPDPTKTTVPVHASSSVETV